MSEKRGQKKGSWEDLLVSTFERIASTPGRLKDPKESVSSAFDWVKGLQKELQERVKEEVSQRIQRIDFNQLSTKVGDHMAANYKMRIQATVDWVPKEKSGAEMTEPPEVDLEEKSSDENEGL